MQVNTDLDINLRQEWRKVNKFMLVHFIQYNPPGQTSAMTQLKGPYYTVFQPFLTAVRGRTR